MKSLHSTVRAIVRLALLCGPLAALPGCVLGEDSGDPPLLSVDFFWEDDTRQGDDTCESADVRSMDWQLTDSEGNVVDEQDSECKDGFNFFGASPGDYTLKVNGYDADHNKQWDATCRLFLDRFDRAYPCDVSRIAE